MSESEYPEHEKLSKIANQSQTIGEFLDWAQMQGARLMHWWEADVDEICTGDLFRACVGGKIGYFDEGETPRQTDRDCRACGGTGIVTHHRAEYRERWPQFTDALAEFFEIDQAKIEQEKRAMLDKLSATHG